MGKTSGGAHQQSLLDYANERMDREMDKKYQGSRTEDVDLTHSTYELTRDLGFSAFRDNINVLNITDVPLTVVVLPLSYGDETVGSISARLATPEPAQIQWAMQEAARRGTNAVYNLDRRSDLVLSDSLNVTVSDVLLIITHVHEHAVSVLDARRVSATENLVLAVLPGLLLDGSGMVPLQPGRFAETVVGEILERMVATPRELECDAVAQPPIEITFIFAAGDLGTRRVRLEAGLRDTMGGMRDRLGAHGVVNGQDMYICHNGKLLADDCVVSDLDFWEFRGVSAEREHLVLLMYLLPGRVQGHLSHIPESGRSFDFTPDSAATEVFIIWYGRSVFVRTHPLCNVRHLKIYAIREGIMPKHLDFFFSVSSRFLENESCPLQFFAEELLHNESQLIIRTTDVEHGYLAEERPLHPPVGAPPRMWDWPTGLGVGAPPWLGIGASPRMWDWPWKRLHLPLEEREFDGKDLNDFDVRTFKKYSSKVVFVNRTSRRVHISCFPTWSKDRRLINAGVNIGVSEVQAGATGEIGTTLKYFPGYGAVDDPCLAPLGAYDIVNIARGMVREMSVVFGVESEDRAYIDYKRLKNVKGGQQVDVLEAFLDKRPKYTHPAGQPSKDALEAHFLPKV